MLILTLTLINENTWHDDNQLVKTNPTSLEVNVVVETVAETSKEVKRIANKGSKEMISESDLNGRDQKKIHTDYIRKCKDLSKLKAYLKRTKRKKLLKNRLLPEWQEERECQPKRKENKRSCEKTQDKEKTLREQIPRNCQKELSGKPVRKPKLNFK